MGLVDYMVCFVFGSEFLSVRQRDVPQYWSSWSVRDNCVLFWVPSVEVYEALEVGDSVVCLNFVPTVGTLSVLVEVILQFVFVPVVVGEQVVFRHLVR